MRTACSRRWALVLIWTLLLVASAGVVSAADEVWPRAYWALRLGTAIVPDSRLAPGLGASQWEQATGMSLGVDLGRHLGVELAADMFEVELKRSGRTIGEYGTFSLIPQVRLRYPLGGGITPYLLGGVGVSINAFNDRKAPGRTVSGRTDDGRGLSVHADDAAVVGAFGGGVEYALTDDIAIGTEVRYLVSRGHEIEVGGRRGDAQVDALLATASLRLMFPRHAAGESLLAAAAPDTTGRSYFTLRVGGAAVTDDDIGGPFRAKPENAAVGDFGLLLGFGAGIDLTRHVGVEVAADGHEPIITLRDPGAIGEYAIYTVVPQVRLRYPMAARLVPYAFGGLGVSYAEFNDRKRLAAHANGTGFGIALAVGAGLEHLVTDNIALGLEAKYVMSRGHELRLEGRTYDVNVDAFLIAAGVRIYLWPLGPRSRAATN